MTEDLTVTLISNLYILTFSRIPIKKVKFSLKFLIIFLIVFAANFHKFKLF